MEIESIIECGSRAIAEASCRAILAGDRVSRNLGIRIIDARAAFGLAWNSHGVSATGIDAHISFQVGVHSPGDRLLIAKALEYIRIGCYRAEVVRGRKS